MLRNSITTERKGEREREREGDRECAQVFLSFFLLSTGPERVDLFAGEAACREAREDWVETSNKALNERNEAKQRQRRAVWMVRAMEISLICFMSDAIPVLELTGPIASERQYTLLTFSLVHQIHYMGKSIGTCLLIS